MAYKDVKVKEDEFRRITSMGLAIKLSNFRSDIGRDTEKVISDAKRIGEYIEDGI